VVAARQSGSGVEKNEGPLGQGKGTTQMTYIEALASFSQAQKMKLAFLVLRKLNGHRGGAHFNMIADGSVDEWEGEPRTTEEIIETPMRCGRWPRATTTPWARNGLPRLTRPSTSRR
jgi:hypothetical protein